MMDARDILDAYGSAAVEGQVGAWWVKVDTLQVIRVLHGRGDGRDEVFRRVTAYFTPDGEFLFENDPAPNGKVVTE